MANALPTPSLVAVHTLAGLEAEFGGYRATLISLECWTTSFRLRFAYPNAAVPVVDILNGQIKLSAQDDLGKEYWQTADEGSDCQRFLVMSRVFEPALSPEAVMLSFRSDRGDRFDVPFSA